MENYPNCKLLYEPKDREKIRDRVEMLSYRRPELLIPERPRSSSLAAAIFCALCAAGLVIMWIWFV